MKNQSNSTYTDILKIRISKDLLVKAKKTAKPLSFERQMQAVIRINEGAVVDKEGADYIQLKISLRLKWYMKLVNLIYKVRDYRKHLLTGFNCEFYRLIKAEPIRMRDLIQWLIDKEKLSFFEARSLTMQYVGNMMQRALIAVELPPEEEPAEDGETEN